MAIDFSFIDHDILGDIADAIRFVDGSIADITPADYPKRIRALDKYIPDYDVLNFYMPNGGTISLNKRNNPAVVELEYWLDENKQWVLWQPDNDGNRSITLTVGQRMYVRNTSESNTRFSISTSDYYNFVSDSLLYADGDILSLICKNPQNTTMTSYCFNRLFRYNTNLVTSPILTSETVSYIGCAHMFYGCSSLTTIKTKMTNISATDCLANWVRNVAAQGDFYCPAELTIPTGADGIPSGWTRHDI